jgi:DNA-binding transcriptional regulator YbjK
MSDTPFTNSCTYWFTDEDEAHCEAVHADVARTLERERDCYKSDVEVITKERDEARAVLQRIADCDWVITLPDRMDAVRKIAREALQ